MRKSLNLTIPKPCHEKWESFESTSKGGFCSSCQKEVIDFTTWSDDEIVNFFKENSQPACGRFKQMQLKVYTPEIITRSSSKWLPLSVLSFTLLFPLRESLAQSVRPLSTTMETPVRVPQTLTSRREVSGVVRDITDNSALPGVNVQLKGTDIMTTTDGNGRYTLIVPDATPDAMIVFSFIGFNTQEVSISGSRIIDMTLDVSITGEIVTVGGVCARRFSPRNIWWKVRNVFRR